MAELARRCNRTYFAAKAVQAHNSRSACVISCRRKERFMAKVHVIHENSIWVEPLRQAFADLKTPYEELFLDEGVLDLRSAPPPGVFYNRMSASSHTRDHRYAANILEP
jgi:hypothetical protein